MPDLIQELRLSLRSLRRTPAFAATAVLTIALGIGATCAIFSVVNAVLLRPLPYRDSGRLVTVWQELRARNVKDFPIPVGDFLDLRERGTLFESVAAVTTGKTSISSDASAGEQIAAAFVTPNMFDVLGVSVIAGRNFTDADGTPQSLPQQQPAPPGPPPAPGAAPPQPGPPPTPPPPPLPQYVILSNEFWMRRFGGDRAIVGQTIDLGNPNRPVVVGILAPGVQLLFPARTNMERTPDIWIASRINFAAGTRNSGSLRAIARMKPGVTVPQAQAQMDGFAADLRRQFPVKANAGVYLNVNPMHEDLVSAVRPSILALMGAVMFVLLIACANVANLVLARASSQGRDLAVRAALGARRGRLIRHMLTESFTVAGAGALLGLLLASLGVRLLIAIGPASLPRADQIRIDPWVLAFAALAAFVSAVAFGLLPALRASRTNVIDVLRYSGRSGALGTSGRVRKTVVVAEVALSFVLLVASGLMLKSFIALQQVPPGFDPNGVLTFNIPNLRVNTFEAARAYVTAVREKVRAVPGVQVVSAASSLALDGAGIQNNPWAPESVGNDLSRFQQADSMSVAPGYFAAMRTRILAGRDFTEADLTAADPSVVIDSLLAAKAFGTEPAVGKGVLVRFGTGNAQRIPVIGVVEHQHWATLTDDGREQLYFLGGPGNARRWILRTAGDPSQLVASVREAVTSLDPRVAVVDIRPMTFYVERAQGDLRFAFVLISIFAGLAVVLASVGLYGVLATLVRQRTAEIGVRMAFGAERSNVFRLIVGEGLRLSLVGLVIGLAAALAVTRVLQTSRLLIGVRPTDPVTFVVMSMVFVVIAIAACSLPALRAARLDPLVALRGE